jgi:hypothetical protein
MGIGIQAFPQDNHHGTEQIEESTVYKQQTEYAERTEHDKKLH